MRPDLYSSNPIGFTLKISINSVNVANIQDYLVKVSSAISFEKINIIDACTVLIEYSGASSVMLYLYSPTATVTNTNQALASGTNSISATLTGPGTWTVAVVHGVTSATAL